MGMDGGPTNPLVIILFNFSINFCSWNGLSFVQGMADAG